MVQEESGQGQKVTINQSFFSKIKILNLDFFFLFFFLALSKMKERYHTGKELEETSLGSRVICEDSELIFEEAPQAYKDIEEIIQDLLDAKLIQVIAIFRPVVTYKTR